ncbi:MAG TPA: lysophospholipid acyltransferase family protein [Pyrinomonadaceae bacterium]|nr:lysophospholipid acyltransferase family protein [Pyrinomonadaceae bacterium]
MRVESRTTTETPAATGVGPRTPGPRPHTTADVLRTLVAWPLVALYTVLMGSLSLALSVFDSGGRLQHLCARTWSRMIVRTALLRVRVHGAEHLREGESYVFLSTHQSWIDIPVMLGYLPAQLRIAAKREVFSIPFLGWHMRRGGHISINRDSTAEAVESLRRAAGGIRGGVSAFIFPEGTRSRDGSLQPFKKGGFKLAMQSGVAAVPVAIVGTRRVLPRDSYVFRPGTVDLYIDPPVPTVNLTDEDLPRLIDDVRRPIVSHF